MHAARLPDGRTMAYDLLGAADGRPVVALHGTPGSRKQLAPADGAAGAAGVRLVVPDRAGFGGSTHDPRRTIASGAEDVVALADHLGLQRYAVIGLSGGGPTALACGALSPARVEAVVTVGSVSPLVPRDPTLPPDRLLVRVARRSERAAQWLFAAMLRMGRTKPERALDRFADMLAEPDRALLREVGPLRQAFIDDLRATAPSAARAAARDFRIFSRPWDVDLAGIAAPVHVWHGTEDRNVPVAHATVIAARCPTAVRHVVDGGGHLLLATHHASILAHLGA